MDAGFFFIEDENVPMHVGSVLVYEGPVPSYGDVVRLFAAKLGTVPRYRQRVKVLPLHVGRPVWVDDEHFQILYHVRHTAVPSPGADDQLRNLASRLFAQRLDMTKPLWEVWLVEGLEGGRWAIISKVILAAVAGGFRDLLAKRDDLAEGQVVRGMVPVSMRSSAERGVLNTGSVPCW